MAVEAFDFPGACAATGNRHVAVIAARCIPSPQVFSRVTMGREGLGYSLFLVGGGCGVLPPGCNTFLGITGSDTLAVPGIHARQAIVPCERTRAVIEVAVTAQAMPGHFGNFRTFG